MAEGRVAAVRVAVARQLTSEYRESRNNIETNRNSGFDQEVLGTYHSSLISYRISR